MIGLAACSSTSGGGSQVDISPTPAVIVVATPASAPVEEISMTPTPASSVDKVAFASTRGTSDKPDIYLMNADGSGLARLTDDPAADTNPAWSPDRRRLVFVSDRSGVNQLYLLEADGNGLQALTDQPKGVSAPAWSPDGSQIAGVVGQGDEARLAMIELENGAVTLLETPLVGITQLAWSPNNPILAVTAVDTTTDRSFDIFQIDLEAPESLINLTNRPGNDEAPAWSPDGKRLAFQSDREGAGEVYVMYANGSAQTPLTTWSGFDGQPSWTSDGKGLAFVSDRAGEAGIYTMTDSGGEVTLLTPAFGVASDPAWQPPPPTPFVDTLIYTAARAGIYDLYTIGVNGLGEQRLTNEPGADNTMPAWSPDGTQVAYVSNQPGNYDILVMTVGLPADQTERVNLTNDPGKDMRPAWSPDGTQLAFESNRSGQWQVWLVAVDGSNLRQLTSGRADSGNPAWSPDGSRLAFASNREGDFDIYVVNADGSTEPVNLTRTPANEFNPAWSPQGDLLALRSDQDGTFQLYLVNTEGQGLRRLLISEANDDQPAWSPDGRQIAFISNRASGSEGQANFLPTQVYALYMFDLETQQTSLIVGEAGVDYRYPVWKPRP